MIRLSFNWLINKIQLEFGFISKNFVNTAFQHINSFIH